MIDASVPSWRREQRARLIAARQAIPPEDVRKRGSGGILVLGEVTIRGIQRGILYSQYDVARPRHRIGPLGQAQPADAPEIVNEPSLHALK